MSYFLTYSLAFVMSGITYCSIEVMYRARTHYSMFFCSGLCVIILLYFYRAFPSINPILFGACSAVVITSLEFIFGVIFNLWLKQNVWDYSNIPINLLGQICLPFSTIWFVFGIVIYYIFRLLRI